MNLTASPKNFLGGDMWGLIGLLFTVIAFAEADVQLLIKTNLDKDNKVTLTCAFTRPELFSAAAWTSELLEYVPSTNISMGYQSGNAYTETTTPSYIPYKKNKCDTNPETAPILCKAKGSWSSGLISSIEDTDSFGPVVDYRWEAFPLQNKENDTFGPFKSVCHLSILTSGSFFIYVQRSDFNDETYLFSLDVKEGNSSDDQVVSSILSCGNHTILPQNCNRIDVKSTTNNKAKVFENGTRSWEQISIEVEPNNAGYINLKLLKSMASERLVFLSHKIPTKKKKSGTYGDSDHIPFNIQIYNPHRGYYKLHDHEIMYTRNNNKSLKLEIEGGTFQIVYYAKGGPLQFSIEDNGTRIHQENIKDLDSSSKSNTRWQVKIINNQGTPSNKYTASITSTLTTGSRGLWAIAVILPFDNSESLRVRKLQVNRTEIAYTIRCMALSSGITVPLGPCKFNSSNVTTPAPKSKIPTLPTTVQPPYDPMKSTWNWISITSLIVNVFLVLCLILCIVVKLWQQGTCCHKEEEPWYRRRGSLLVTLPSRPSQMFSELLNRDKRYSEEPVKQKNNNATKKKVRAPVMEESSDPVYDDIDKNEAGPSFRSENHVNIPKGEAKINKGANENNLELGYVDMEQANRLTQQRGPKMPNKTKLNQERSTNMQRNSPSKQKQPNKLGVKGNPSTEDPIYGNFDTIRKAFKPPAEAEVEYGNIQQQVAGASGFSNPNFAHPNDNPEYGNFEISVIDEPIFGKKGPTPLVIDTDDPIYGNFDVISRDELEESEPIYGNV